MALERAAFAAPVLVAGGPLPPGRRPSELPRRVTYPSTRPYHLERISTAFSSHSEGIVAIDPGQTYDPEGREPVLRNRTRRLGTCNQEHDSLFHSIGQ